MIQTGRNILCSSGSCLLYHVFVFVCAFAWVGRWVCMWVSSNICMCMMCGRKIERSMRITSKEKKRFNYERRFQLYCIIIYLPKNCRKERESTSTSKHSDQNKSFFSLLTSAEPSEIHCNKLSNSSVVYWAVQLSKTERDSISDMLIDDDDCLVKKWKR